jgi:hypothetical protein
VDIAAWLRELGLERYEPVFRENEIDAQILPRLTAEDLTSLGVTAVGHRRKLLDAVAALRKGDVTLATRSAELAADITELLLPGGERRQVTVLFADLSGYTRLSREIDAEELHALAGRFFDVVDTVVEGYGGTVRKHIGDCVMAVFGAPVAHSNDSERAARAALEIQCQVSALAGAPFVSQITSINEDIEALRWRELQTAELRGRSQQRLQLLTDESHALDLKLQREMTLMVERVHAEIQSLDEALEREMRLMTDANTARIVELRERLSALEARAVMTSHP